MNCQSPSLIDYDRQHSVPRLVSKYNCDLIKMRVPNFVAIDFSLPIGVDYWQRRPTTLNQSRTRPRKHAGGRQLICGRPSTNSTKPSNNYQYAKRRVLWDSHIRVGPGKHHFASSRDASANQTLKIKPVSVSNMPSPSKLNIGEKNQSSARLYYKPMLDTANMIYVNLSSAQCQQ